MLKELLAYSLLTVGKRLNGEARQRVLCWAHSVSPGAIWSDTHQEGFGGFIAPEEKPGY